jgi:hypothetical protein
MIIPDRWLRRLHLFVCDVGHTSDEMPQSEQRGARNRRASLSTTTHIVEMIVPSKSVKEPLHNYHLSTIDLSPYVKCYRRPIFLLHRFYANIRLLT